LFELPPVGFCIQKNFDPIKKIAGCVMLILKEWAEKLGCPVAGSTGGTWTP